jgi:hypothetical protein
LLIKFGKSAWRFSARPSVALDGDRRFIHFFDFVQNIVGDLVGKVARKQKMLIARPLNLVWQSFFIALATDKGSIPGRVYSN